MSETEHPQPAKHSHLERWQANQRAQQERARLRDDEVKRALKERDRQRYIEKRKSDQRRNSANYRAKKKRERSLLSSDDAGLQEALGPAPIVVFPKETLLTEARQFSDWLKLGGSAQRQLAGRRHEIMRSRVALVLARDDLGDDPSYAHFAQYLGRTVGGSWTKESARTRLNALRRLEEPGGPWTSTCL